MMIYIGKLQINKIDTKSNSW
ncbi:MAG: hypothetical protein US41_C0018G0010, partial [Parcubacteria group bacterium GW2011_GWB1_37_13]